MTVRSGSAYELFLPDLFAIDHCFDGCSAAAQEALAKELLDRVADYQTPDRPAQRQQIIQERLAKPLRAVSRDEVMQLLLQKND